MSAPFHAVNPDQDDEEKYNSADDQDFNPEAQDYDESSSEDGASPNTSRKTAHDNEDVDFDNSGDEATLLKARRKKKAKAAKHTPGEEDDGEAGLIKTRAQRKAETLERKPRLQSGTATVDVDSLWASMSAPQPSSAEAPPTSHDTNRKEEAETSSSDATSNTIVIKRKFEFAGEVMEEEKVVSSSSAEAKLYLAEKARETDAQKPKTASDGPKPLRRPVKRKSMFAADVSSALAAKGPKLNTLQKSKMDWAAHVDKEGIKEELDVHGRAKDNLTDRMDFLERMNQKREDGRTK